MSRTKQNDKRSRLIQAADTLIYHGTFHTTTLADIAKAADVPLGNVYYYFKTKEMIIQAVITARSLELKEHFRAWEQQPSISARLEALITYFTSQTDNFSRYGCPIGSLCQELGKYNNSNIANLAAKLMHDILQWTGEQFQLANKSSEEASSLAEQLLSSLEGMALLTLVFKDPALVEQQSALLSTWVQSQVGASQAPSSTAANANLQKESEFA